MRKLKLQVQITLDGYIAGPNGEMDFMQSKWDNQLINYIQEITDPVDCILLGRKLAEEFIPYWQMVSSDHNHEEFMAGKKFKDTPKIVFTKTLLEPPWDKTTIANGKLSVEIQKLKQQDGNDIIVYGGATFVSSLIKENLIDEYHFLVNPTAIGNGMPIFSNIINIQQMKLVKSIACECGIVVLNYIPK